MKNFALIGCGAVSIVHAKAIENIENGRLYGVFDARQESAEKFAAEHGCKAFATLEEMLADENVDIVNVCTPSGLHAKLAMQAVRAGKHVIVEKPMAITKEDLDALVQESEAKQVKVAVITQLRFTPAVQKLKKALDEGKLGKILIADFRGKYYRAPEYYTSCPWRGTWAMDGGGALMNQGIHGVDLLQYLVGGVKSVRAVCRTVAREIEAEDCAYVFVEYKNGAIGSIQGTTVASPGFPREIEIHGTKGSIVLQEDTITLWDIEGEDETQASKTTSNSASEPMAIPYLYHKLQFEDLVDAINTGRAPLVDAHEGRKPVDIILGAYESSRTGKQVEIK